MRHIFLLSGAVLLLTGCGRDETPSGDSPPVPEPGGTLGSLADYAVWLGGVGLLIAVILAAFGRTRTAISAALAGGGLVVGGVVLGWIATHIGLIILGVALVAVGYILWRNRRRVDAALEAVGIDIIPDGDSEEGAGCPDEG